MKSLLVVCLKELKELVRDRRTLFLLLVMGPLLMPVLIIGIGTLAQNRAKTQTEKPLEIVMIGVERAPNLIAFLASQGITRKPLVGDADAAIRNQEEDVYLRIGEGYAKDWRDGRPALVEIVHDSTRQDAAIPVSRVEAALTLYSGKVAALRLVARGISPSVAAPLAVSHKDLSTPEARRSMALSFLLYLLIFSAFVGGSHLIIDATAGERERQSLEPLLATPASRSAIVSGKMAAACIVGLISLSLTLLGLKAGTLLAPGVGRVMDVSGPAIVKMLLILVPMLLIGSSLLTYISAGSKSVKEAQGHMPILMLLPMVPTILLMVNPVRTALWQFVVPFLAQNQILLKVIRSETISPQEWAVYFGAGLGLAAVLWFAAARRYRQERLAISG